MKAVASCPYCLQLSRVTISRQLQESDDEVNRKPVSKWNLEESAIRFISIEGRMLCYGDAVPGFESCRDNGSLNEEDVWHLSEDVFYTGGECAFELVPCVWAPQLTYFRRHESVNGLPPQSKLTSSNHFFFFVPSFSICAHRPHQSPTASAFGSTTAN